MELRCFRPCGPSWWRPTMCDTSARLTGFVLLWLSWWWLLLLVHVFDIALSKIQSDCLGFPLFFRFFLFYLLCVFPLLFFVCSSCRFCFVFVLFVLFYCLMSFLCVYYCLLFFFPFYSTDLLFVAAAAVVVVLLFLFLFCLFHCWCCFAAVNC